MAMHWRKLILARDHDLFGIKHTTTALEVLGIAVARGEKKQTKIRKIALTIISNIPTKTSIENSLRVA